MHPIIIKEYLYTWRCLHIYLRSLDLMDLGQADKSVRYLVNRSNENLIDYLNESTLQ